MKIKHSQQIQTNPNAAERGESLIEVMVTMCLVSVASISIAYTTITGMRDYKRNVREEVAAELVQNKMEELAATDPSTLSSNDDSTESNLMQSGISFSRAVSIRTNDNGSRTVTVSVQPNNNVIGGTFALTNTLPLWNAD